MVYKNFILRSIFSIIFLLTYFIIINLNFNYLYYFITFLYICIFIEILLSFIKYKVLPIIYILISFIFFINIDFNYQIFFIFNFFIFIIITFDTFSYVIGKYFGSNQLTKISPNKTIEGLLGGIFFSTSLSYLFAIYFNIILKYNLIIFIF